MTGTTDGAARTEVLASLERLDRRAQASLSRLADIQAQLDALVALPMPTAVHAVMDADGLLTELTIDRDLPPADLEHDLALALAEAARRRPVADPARAIEASRAAAGTEGLDLTRLLDRLFSGASTTLDPEPAPRWNDRHTVAVTVQAGVLRRVRCDHEWLGTTSREAVALEVRQAVNDAVGGADDVTAGR